MARFYRSPAQKTVALLTDFGFKDSYVGVMKAVILSRAPSANVVDLCHNIMPQDVVEAAFVLASSYSYFPSGTIFTCVVDPGVGTSRRVLCLTSEKYTFLSPDNGLLSIMSSELPSKTIYAATNEALFLKPVSGTFHGRDIFAPLAGHLAAGEEPAKLGPVTTRIAGMNLPRPIKTAEGVLKGQVVYADQFGNIITNISESTVTANLTGDLSKVSVTVGRRTVNGIERTYSDVPEGGLLALFGSSGFLEISVNMGNAQQTLASQRGDEVVLAKARVG